MSSFCRSLALAAVSIALQLAPTSGSNAQMVQDALNDPEGSKLAVALVPIYESLAHHRLFAQPSPASSEFGRPITDLTRDDVCGCYFADDGGAVNAEQCEPIKKSGSERQARLGIVRIVDYDRLRRSAFPNPEAHKEMAVTSALGLVDRNKRLELQNAMRVAVSDPHLVLLAPSPVAERVMGLTIAKVENGRRPWEACDLTVGDNAFVPPAVLNGFVARALLYAAKTYKVDVGYPLGTLVKVSTENPATPWEMARNILIQRYHRPYKLNPYIPVPGGVLKKAPR
ncbi:MAG: hypothetical protein DI537_05370 [Stutzerimonas stutzeri]|nr:MAG: hypothetical protein DI537_05370 [Stutzerimonas stutzeri]